VEKVVEAPPSGVLPEAASNAATLQGQSLVVTVTKTAEASSSAATTKATMAKAMQLTTQPAAANFDASMTKFKKKIEHWSKDFEKMVGDLEACQKV
jgi:hypothetical protein